MSALLGFFASALLGAPLPHAVDRPLADVTVQRREAGVQVSLMLNFQFLDAVLGLAGDAASAPTQAEMERARDALVSLLAGHRAVQIDGRTVKPTIFGFQAAPPPIELQEREPQLTRKLTQIRFHLLYGATDVSAMRLRWSWFPEHPLYDVPESPVAPMEVPVVVLRREAEPLVLTYTVGQRVREICFVDGSGWSGFLWLGLVSLGLLVFAFRRLPRMLATTVIAASVVSCDGGDGTASYKATTKSYEVVILPSSTPVRVNEHFAVDVAIRSMADAKVPAAVQVDADMPSHGHGMNTKPRVTARGPGRWRAEGMLLHMPGDWEIYVYMGKGAAMERAVFRLRL